jgi:hypothetical protein
MADSDEIKRRLLRQTSQAQPVQFDSPGRYTIPGVINCRGAKPEGSGLVLELELQNGALIHVPLSIEAMKTLAVFFETIDSGE